MFFEKFGEVTTSMAVATVTTVIILLLTLKSLYTRRHILKFTKHTNGLTYYPIIGNGYELIGKDIFIGVQGLIQKFGLPCNVWSFHDYYYLTADATEIKAVLNDPKTFDKMKVYDNFKFAFNDSLLLAQAEPWKKHRKFFSKSFSQPILNTFVQHFYGKSLILLDILKESEYKDKFQVFEKYSFDAFCATMIGINYNLQTDTKVKMVEWLGELQAIISKRLSASTYYPTCLWRYSNEGRHALRLLGKCKTFISDVVRDKRKAFAENPVSIDSFRALPLLDSMLLAEESDKMSEDQIFKEIILFTLAATDTSGFTLAYTFTLLGMYPQVQAKVYEEVMSTIGPDSQICYEDLPKLKYTERAILESMRILPVTPILGRFATGDAQIGAKIIPKDSNILISVFNLHRNEKYWTEPLKYDPDRFLPEEVAKREPYSYIPFSGGGRNCIGKTYAMMLMKTAVANIVRNYEMTSKYKSVEELELISCITMRTKDDLDCRFVPRKDT